MSHDPTEVPSRTPAEASNWPPMPPFEREAEHLHELFRRMIPEPDVVDDVVFRELLADLQWKRELERSSPHRLPETDPDPGVRRTYRALERGFWLRMRLLQPRIERSLRRMVPTEPLARETHRPASRPRSRSSPYHPDSSDRSTAESPASE